MRIVHVGEVRQGMKNMGRGVDHNGDKKLWASLLAG